ncbi:polysaccharide deacetylase family protein [Lutimonas vermicola]|uniref:Polysaccharide deacetylase family protein n=1 Tax=Lutimonas vermicola TaxID=414288 RepID=A0ABU9L5T8_9FLAO
MFHSIGLENYQWRSKYISEPISLMNDKLSQIHKEGYKSLFMHEAHESRFNKKDNLIHLNYDDGYLDNWVHLFALLKKYNLKATIFMTSDFIDPREIRRSQNSSEYHKTHCAKDCCAGFLSFPEMREMEASGLVEIQSHAKTHTWYFKGPKIVDFWHPGAATKVGGPIWMLWNRFPELKPYYLTRAEKWEKKIPYGTPIYEHGKSLETHQYFPNDEALSIKLIEEVALKEGFFEQDNWREKLLEFATANADTSKGKYEDKEEYLIRVKEELQVSKQVIEEGLGHQIDGICWPGGGIEKEVIVIAKELGYTYFTLPSKWKKAPSKLFSEMIPRIGPMSQLAFHGKILGTPSERDFSNYLKISNGYKLYSVNFFFLRALKFIKHELSLILNKNL